MKKRKLTKSNNIKELRAWLIILSLNLTWIIPCAYDYTHREPIEEVVEDSAEDIIRWKEEVEEVTIEKVELDVVTAHETVFYNVPLSEELQLHIFEECEKHNIAPSIVIAMIEKESSYDASKIGDNGDSLGLMQIQPKWHQTRMDRLGCTDLLDPFQNVTVGIDYISELIRIDSDLYWVLMAYNGGNLYSTVRMDSGNYSDYALSVTERASELAKEVE